MFFSVPDMWFELDTEPKFVVESDGKVVSQNSAARSAVCDGQVGVDGLGMLHFGSVRSNALLLSALKTRKPDASWRERLVLRGRDGAWLGASLLRLRDDPLAILSFKAEASLTRQAFEALAAAFLLTKAEHDVLFCLMKGQLPKEIAFALNISEHTVRAHLRVMYTKMDVKGLTGVIRRASVLI